MDVLIIFPAAALGIWAMIRGGVSPALWGQQAAALVLCLLTAVPTRRACKKKPTAILAAMMVIFLAASLFGVGAGGAKRWVKLLVFNVNAAMLVLPAVLVLLYGLHRPCPLLLCAAAVLCAQPDVSQLTALSVASVLILCIDGRKKRQGIAIAAQAALVFICLQIPAAVEPVPYCESILAMLEEISPVLMAAGLLALMLIPGYWVYHYFKERGLWMLSLAVYYAVVMLFGLSGEYPMPFMGFGLSPVVGYGLVSLVMPAAGKEQ